MDNDRTVKVSELRTMSETAELLGVAKSWVHRLSNRGVLKPVYKAPGHTGVTLFSETDIMKYMLDKETGQ